MHIVLILSVIIIAIVITATITKQQVLKIDTKDKFSCKLRQEWINHAFWTRTLGILILGDTEISNIQSVIAKLGQTENTIVALIIAESLKDKDVKVDREKLGA